MNIKVLAMGCAACDDFYDVVAEVGAKFGATVEKINDVVEILEYRVIALPGLVINGKVLSSGNHLTAAEVEELIKKEI